jgi:hypothetical protein
MIQEVVTMSIQSRRNVVLGLAAGTASLLAACQAAPVAQVKTAAPAAPGASTLFLMVDVVQGSKNLSTEQRASRSCVLASRFPRNSEIVWRARVHDPVSGEPMDGNLAKLVEVQLANGTKLAAKYGPHPKDPPNEDYWTASWVIPKDHATGTLKYKVVATANDGRVGEFEPFPVASSLLTVIDETLPDAPPKV